MIIIPIKWLFHWEYTLFSDKPIWLLNTRNARAYACRAPCRGWLRTPPEGRRKKQGVLQNSLAKLAIFTRKTVMGFHEIQKKDLMGFLMIFGWLSWLKEHLGFMAIITYNYNE